VLREEQVELELDGVSDAELGMRLDGVLRTLCVLFLEWYSAHAGDTQIDEDLCRSAIRLNAMLLATRFATPAWPRAAHFVLASDRSPMLTG
jgi:predicted RNA polymerase sigma factor